MKPFNFNNYIKNNPLLKESIDDVNEVSKSKIRKDLEKVSGLRPSSPEIDEVIKRLDAIAVSKGFKRVRTTADEKPEDGASGVYNYAKWSNNKDEHVELFHTIDEGDVDVDDLQINFDFTYHNGNDAAKDWLDPKTWEYNMTTDASGDPIEDDDEYYNY